MSHCWKKKTKGFNSLSHFSRQDLSFLWVKIFVKQILWVMLKKWVQFCESCQKKGFNSVSYIQKINSWSHFYFFLFKTFFESFFFLQKRFNSVSHNFWKVQNSFNHIEKKRFNSVGHIQEKGSIHWDILKKGSILRVKLKKKRNNSLLQNKKFHSLSLSFWHNVQFFESFFQKKFNSSSHFWQNSFSILWVIF